MKGSKVPENEDKVGNKPKALMEYFSTPDRPVTPSEFRQFWTSLMDEEKLYFRTVELD
jgi:hypothetical protein